MILRLFRIQQSSDLDTYSVYHNSTYFERKPVLNHNVSEKKELIRLAIMVLDKLEKPAVAKSYVFYSLPKTLEYLITNDGIFSLFIKYRVKNFLGMYSQC